MSEKIAADTRLYASAKVWAEERTTLMADLAQMNKTLDRLEAQNADWTSTIRTMRRSKALLLDQIGLVNRKIGRAYEENT